MKRNFFLLLLSSLIALSGCSKNIKNENAVVSFNSYEHEVIDLNFRQLEYMIEQNYSFPLLMYTEDCSSCLTAKENLAEVAKDIKYQTYEIEMDGATSKYLSENYPDLFSVNDIYPSLSIINNKTISYKSPLESLNNQLSLKKLLKAYSLDTNITTLTTFDSYLEYKSAKKDFLVYAYYIDEEDTSFIYHEYLLPACLKSNKNVLIINKSIAEFDLFYEIESISRNANESFIIYEDKEVKSVLENPSTLDGQLVQDYLFTFF